MTLMIRAMTKMVIRAMTKMVIMFTTWFSLGASKSSPGGFCLSGSELWEQKRLHSSISISLVRPDAKFAT